MNPDQLLDLLDAGRCPDCRGDLEPDGEGRLACEACGATWGRPR